ncbi:hypothetical protein DYQ05_10060 [Treponema pedis]|uniref:Uncharacterized protein n=3 Tax=Treponema pedis TaxID=409322 RepID=S6A8W8_9SPIR|nr:hypothetical protein TPE_2080 [Treponema pedis str. T A4]QSI05231.1 hypothetical protein DYQ05_10060 [Treponema pedis]
MEIFENLVYTILQSKKIDEMIRNKKTVFVEKKIWRTAFNFLNEAKRQNREMYLIIAPAENTFYLYA